MKTSNFKLHVGHIWTLIIWYPLGMYMYGNINNTAILVGPNTADNLWVLCQIFGCLQDFLKAVKGEVNNKKRQQYKITQYSLVTV